MRLLEYTQSIDVLWLELVRCPLDRRAALGCSVAHIARTFRDAFRNGPHVELRDIR